MPTERRLNLNRAVLLLALFVGVSAMDNDSWLQMAFAFLLVVIVYVFEWVGIPNEHE